MSKPSHKQGCESLGGYGHGIGPCTCGASKPSLTVVAHLRAEGNCFNGYGACRDGDVGSFAVVRLSEAQARIDELERDAARLDWLEAKIRDEGELHLHDGNHPRGIGLGLFCGKVNQRSLREAIDTANPDAAITAQAGSEAGGEGR